MIDDELDLKWVRGPDSDVMMMQYHSSSTRRGTRGPGVSAVPYRDDDLAIHVAA